MNWIDADRMFPTCMTKEEAEHAHIFTVTRKEWIQRQPELGPLFAKELDPPTQQKKLEEYIGRVRPDLAGCKVSGFVFDLSALRYEILVFHQSLPVRAWEQELGKSPLFGIPAPCLTVSVDKPEKEESWRDRDPLL